uniref:Uncharacterized protein n=1 Tax=Panagrolaimus sp. PS1159 TaxID=55785 RepID=A0AC35GJL1_9BILA
MSYNATKPVLLSSRETYELYEKRTVTPPRGAPIGYIPAPTHPISPPPITPIRHHGQHSSTFPGGDPKAGQAFCGGPYNNVAPPPPKSNSPSVRFDDSINNIEPQMYDGKYSVKRDNEGNFTQKITTMFPSLKGKESLPLGWIICIAITVPLFVIIVLFAAVWLQELGML